MDACRAAPSAVPRPSSSNDPNARLVPLRPSWQAQQQPGASRTALSVPQGAWQQPQQRNHQQQDRDSSGDFWSDQDTFSAELQQLQLRGESFDGPRTQPTNRSSTTCNTVASTHPDFDDMWHEQAAFAAEIQAMHSGDLNRTVENIRADADTAPTQAESEDDEDMWRDLAAFEAEMDQMAMSGGQTGAASRGGSSIAAHGALRGLSASAAAFNFQPSSQQTAAEQNLGHSPSVGSGTENSCTAFEEEGAESSSDSGPGLCPQYRTSGRCARGEACNYLHGNMCEVHCL